MLPIQTPNPASPSSPSDLPLSGDLEPPLNNRVQAELSGVWKQYYILTRQTPRLGHWVFNKVVEHYHRTRFWALEDVSLQIRRGEILGIIGPNGSGKSTLLKILAGITPPTRGRTHIRGRVASLLEVGVGFHPELTGMENIFYHAALYGLGREQVLERLEEIIAFSGLRDYLHEPVKHYSSGMYSRLGCSVALHLDPEIALVDEALSVGDSEFRERVYTRFRWMIEQGVTVVLVTHEVATAAELCHRLIWLEDGRIRMQGSPPQVRGDYERDLTRRRLDPEHFWVRALQECNQSSDGQNSSESPDRESGIDKPVLHISETASPILSELHSVRLLDEDKNPIQQAAAGRPLILEIVAQIKLDIPDASLQVLVWRSDGQLLSRHASPPVHLKNNESHTWRLCWDPVLWIETPIFITTVLTRSSNPDRSISGPPKTLTVKILVPDIPIPNLSYLIPCPWESISNPHP